MVGETDGTSPATLTISEKPVAVRGAQVSGKMRAKQLGELAKMIANLDVD
jgi:FixJ family two-component response regulator